MTSYESKATGGASDWAIGMAVASQLPGRRDGPADVYRHLLIAAELNRIFSEDKAARYLWGHEVLGFVRGEYYSGQNSGSGMDTYVNKIGAAIGRYVRSVQGSTDDVVRLAGQVMKNSFPTRSWHTVRWNKVPGAGFKMSGARPTLLPNGIVLPAAVVAKTDPNAWRSSNPEDQNQVRIPTSQANKPIGTWQSNFNFSNRVGSIAQAYMRRNRPAGPPDPVVPHETPYP
jgi:hypothetical protein